MPCDDVTHTLDGSHGTVTIASAGSQSNELCRSLFRGQEAEGAYSYIVVAGPEAVELIRRDVEKAKLEILLVEEWLVPKVVGAIAPMLVVTVRQGVSDCGTNSGRRRWR